MGIRRKSPDEIRQENKVKALVLENETLHAQIEYVAIMADIDIGPINQVEEEAENV